MDFKCLIFIHFMCSRLQFWLLAPFFPPSLLHCTVLIALVKQASRYGGHLHCALESHHLFMWNELFDWAISWKRWVATDISWLWEGRGKSGTTMHLSARQTCSCCNTYWVTLTGCRPAVNCKCLRKERGEAAVVWEFSLQCDPEFQF